MFPQTGEWAGGEAAFPAALKALNQINRREDILPGYYLNLSAYDTRVNQINNGFFIENMSVFF